MEEVMFPSVYDRLGNNFIFQQDNAPSCHCSKMTKARFPSTEIEVMGWPARRPDLNPIEKFVGLDGCAIGKKKNTQEMAVNCG